MISNHTSKIGYFRQLIKTRVYVRKWKRIFVCQGVKPAIVITETDCLNLSPFAINVTLFPDQYHVWGPGTSTGLYNVTFLHLRYLFINYVQVRSLVPSQRFLKRSIVTNVTWKRDQPFIMPSLTCHVCSPCTTVTDWLQICSKYVQHFDSVAFMYADLTVLTSHSIKFVVIKPYFRMNTW